MDKCLLQQIDIDFKKWIKGEDVSITRSTKKSRLGCKFVAFMDKGHSEMGDKHRGGVNVQNRISQIEKLVSLRFGHGFYSAITTTSTSTIYIQRNCWVFLNFLTPENTTRNFSKEKPQSRKNQTQTRQIEEILSHQYISYVTLITHVSAQFTRISKFQLGFAFS